MVPWTKPEDVPATSVAASHGLGALQGPHDGGSSMLFLDGSVRFVKATIAPFKYPRSVKFIEALPKTQTGKIQRFRLRPGA